MQNVTDYVTIVVYNIVTIKKSLPKGDKNYEKDTFIRSRIQHDPRYVHRYLHR